jgi:hypothetical protein
MGRLAFRPTQSTEGIHEDEIATRISQCAKALVQIGGGAVNVDDRPLASIVTREPKTGSTTAPSILRYADLTKRLNEASLEIIRRRVLRSIGPPQKRSTNGGLVASPSFAASPAPI